MSVEFHLREHVTKAGETTLYVRVKIPERQADGTIKYRYTERSSGSGKRVDARRFAEKVYQDAHTEAHRVRDGEVSADSFAACVIRYLNAKGGKSTPVDHLIPETRFKVRANKSYLVPIIEAIGTMRIADIDQAVLDDLAARLYPGRAAATVNRQLYTPVIAVMTYIGQRHKLKRPEGHDSLPELSVPKDDWYPAVLRAANPYLRAFLITIRLTGRRPDELLNRTRDHYAPEHSTLMVWDGKGEQHIMLTLPSPAKIALDALPDLRQAEKGDKTRGGKLTQAKRNFLFGTNRNGTMRAWLIDACREAGVPYHMAKEAGRHAFVTKNLQEGRSLKWVQDVGRWKTLKVVAEKYGHLEQQDIDREAKEAGEAWFEKILSEPVTIEASAEVVRLPVAKKTGTTDGH